MRICLRADVTAYRRSLAAAVVACVLFTAPARADEAPGPDGPGASAPGNFYLNADGSVTRRLDRIEKELSDLKTEVASLKTMLTTRAGSGGPTPPVWSTPVAGPVVNPNWKPGSNVRVDGKWYTQQADGTLAWCTECNGGPQPAAAVVGSGGPIGGGWLDAAGIWHSEMTGGFRTTAGTTAVYSTGTVLGDPATGGGFQRGGLFQRIRDRRSTRTGGILLGGGCASCGG